MCQGKPTNPVINNCKINAPILTEKMDVKGTTYSAAIWWQLLWYCASLACLTSMRVIAARVETTTCIADLHVLYQ
jgi:hypothetical protein